MSPNDLSLPAPRRDLRLPFGVALAAAACLAPLFLGTYALHAIIIALIFLLPAHGLNLLVGYTGLLSLAQAAFFGIGAYTSGLMAVHFGTPFYLNFLAAGLLAGAIALPLGIPALRLRATSFVMCTLGFVIIGQAIAKNWIGLTRGDMGLSGIPKPYFALGPASFTISGTTSFYYLVLVIAVMATLAAYLIVRSAAGRNMVAIRENETLAESVGIPTWRYKLVVFMISAAFAGLGGSIYAHYLTVVSPLTFQMYYSTTMLIIVLGGGAGTISGVVFGSLLFVGLSEALRVAPEVRMIAYGLSLLALVFWFPKGFAPLIDRFWSFLGGTQMTGLPILEISGLNKSYGAVRAVDDVSLHVNRGEICGLIGPNGSGKSTFFDCASGLTKPQAGTVKLDGQDITGWSLNRIAREGRMLRSFQKTVVFSALDVEENLVIAGQMFTFPGLWSTFGIGAMARARVEALRERAREFIKIAGLWDVRHQPAGKLSGGQQKLIQFASMLMPEPKLILLDEPMAGINPKLIERVVESIRFANQKFGVSFLVIEHNIDVVTDICERIVVLDQGRKLAEGTPDEIVRNQAVREAYLGG